MATPVSNSVSLLIATNNNNGTLNDEFVSGLVQGGSWQFGNSSRVLTYSLDLNDYIGVDEPDGPAPGPGDLWSENNDLASAFAQALVAWSNVANISFQQVGTPDAQFYYESAADMSIVLTGDELQTEIGAVAVGIFPDPSLFSGIPGYPNPEGDIAIDNDHPVFADGVPPGSPEYQVLLHEIGHALGLKHAHDDGGNGRPTFEQLGIGTYAIREYTLMIQETSGPIYYAVTPMLMDILAIQHIYGANMGYHLGNDTYFLSNTGTMQAIWDAGGRDTMDASANTTGMTINLSEGSKNYSGDNASLMAIAYGVTIENAIGGSGNDTVNGNAADNLLSGGQGSDTLRGEAGNDTLDGGGGADYMIGGTENDTYIVDNLGDAIAEGSNAGTDLVQSSVTYTLGNDIENLTLTGSSAINGTGNTLNNTLTGNGFDNVLNGGTGADTMVGGAGNDTYVVDNAGDVVTESSNGGTDHVQSSVTYSLGSDVENLTLTGSSAINATGNALNNILTGNTGVNFIDGGLGNNTLNGGDNNDIMWAQGGADALFGDNGDDYLEGGGGGDSYNGGAGIDTASFTWSDQGVSVNLLFGTGSGGYAQGATLDGIENLRGSALQDFLTGDAGNNTLFGLAGADFLDGGLGNNILIGGDGNDVIWAVGGSDILWGDDGDDYLEGGGGGDIYHGGNGIDLASLTWSDQAVTVNLLYGTGSGGYAQGATFNGIENVRGSAHNDYLTGDTGNNTLGLGGADLIDGGYGNNILMGGDGNDIIWAQNGSDVLYGEGGDDYLEGAGGGDTYNGGTGSDTASFYWSGQGVNVDLLTGAASGGYAQLSQFISIENARGSAFDDYLGGDASNNTLWGNNGNDLLNGGANGNDILVGDAGHDVMEGMNGDDLVTDSGGNNLLIGGSGNDALFGESGNEFYIGGSGNDVINTVGGADIIAFNRGDGQDSVHASTGADNTISLGKNIRYSDMSLSKSGMHLVLNLGGSGEQITLIDWYAVPTNKSVATLQVIVEATLDYDALSADPLHNKKIARFDFQGLVDTFDANGQTPNWALTNELLNQHLGGSDTAAMGGDLAYRYGLNGNYANIGFDPVVGILSDGNFGTSTQNLQSLAALESGFKRLN